MQKFNQNFKVILVIVWEEYYPTGINSFIYVRREAKREISKWWTMEKAINTFIKFNLHNMDKIVKIHHEYEFQNRSMNHHNTDEIVL